MPIQTRPPALPTEIQGPLPLLRVILGGVLLGAAYGIFVRYIFGIDLGGVHIEGAHGHGHFFDVMTKGFIFGAPLSLGFITVWVCRRHANFHWWMSPILPWVSVMACMAACFIFAWEGLICIALWIPLASALSSVGGVAAWLLWLPFKSARARLRCVAIVALFPFIVSPLEQMIPGASDIRTVNTSIEIRATPAVIWEQIRSVPRITESEHSFGLSHLLGFPRPTEAVISGDGVGAVRYARFEGDVLFVETITVWRPLEQLSFSILADTKNIPPTTFDEHVTIGGPHFDVFNGTYRLEPIGNGKVILHLSSDQRLSTRFNIYSHLWTEWLMADLQNYILRIIKKRCEARVESGAKHD